jgi:YegS/Rv2252/BmrU family lipid kinase
MPKIYLIVNPYGGNGKGPSICEKVKPVFADAGFEPDIKETRYPGHAKEMANSLPLDGFSALCAIGGDGTMHELVNGLMSRKDGRKIPVGLIPAGTGNAFIYSMNCLDPVQAARRITLQNKRKIDIARIEADGETIFAFNAIGWGMPNRVNATAGKLRFLGRRRYDIASLIEISKNRRHRAKLTIGDRIIDGYYSSVMACNNPHTGTGMKIAPHAKIDDGLIDLLIMRNVSRLRIFLLFLKISRGSHIHDTAVGYYQTDRFSIAPAEKSTLIVDGETAGSTPVQVQVLKGGLEIFA